MRNRPLKREQKKALTRTRLLKAAEKVFARRGYGDASLDQVAAEAGFSKGAVYSNFKSKQDLFLVLLDEHIEERISDLRRTLVAGEDLDQQLQESADRYIKHLNESEQWHKVLFEAWTCSMRDRRFGAKFMKRFQDCRRALAEGLNARFERFGLPLPLPAEQLAAAIDALGFGIMVQKLASPNTVPDNLLGDIVALILRSGATVQREMGYASRCQVHESDGAQPGGLTAEKGLSHPGAFKEEG